MATLSMMCVWLLMVALVFAVSGLPVPDPTLAAKSLHHRHMKAGPPEGDKVLAIGTPLLMTRYHDYGPRDEWGDHEVPRSWRNRLMLYRSLFKCPEGEKRDAIGICRQPWDSIDPDYDF